MAPEQLEGFRKRFAIFREKIYLNSCSQGALSDAVEEAFQNYLESWREQGSPWEVWVERSEELRAVFAALIGADKEEVAITFSASSAINSVASSFDYRGRKKVVLGEFEFPTMAYIWLAQRPLGAEVHLVKAKDNALPPAAYEAAIDDETLIVPLTRVCFKNGFRLDVESIVQIAHDRGAYVFLDDYQDSGTRPIDVKKLGVDFMVTGALKYLLGPPGVAFLYVRGELIEKLRPRNSGWFSQANPFSFSIEAFKYSPTARRFQSGTPPIPSVYGALAGIELIKSVGLEAIEQRVAELTRALIRGAQEMRLASITPEDSIGPLVVLRAKNINRIVEQLAARDIIVSARQDGLRISFHAYNTLEDVRAVLAALEENISAMARRGESAGSPEEP